MKQYIFALGFFDGVHLGHQALLSECVRLARPMGAVPAAITFDNHPQAAFTTKYPPLLTGLHDRVTLLGRFGMEEIHALPVNKYVMSTPWQDFLQKSLAEGAAGFVCGDDFRFGHRGEGNGALLLEYCSRKKLPCVIVPEQTLEGRRISSSHIRSLLEAGSLEQAEKFLGHPYQLSGLVVHGQGLGHTIGIPTANLEVSKKLALPPKGVYACRAHVLGKTYGAVTNIGTRPTVGGTHVTVEPWLLDFAGDIYGEMLTLEFIRFLRPEKKFASLEELKAEILRNAQETRNALL